MKNKILQFQLGFLILSSLFSFGGTNEIDANVAGQNFFLQQVKGISLIAPIIFYALILLIKPNQLKLLKSIYKNNFLLILYVLWSVLSLFWSVNASYSLNKITIFSLYLLSASCIISQYQYYYKDKTTEKIISHLHTVLSTIAIIIFVLWVYYGMQSGRASRMIFGPYCHANQIASFTGITLLYFLFYNNFKGIESIKQKNNSFINNTLYILLIFTIIISFSRSVFVALIFGLLFSFLFMEIQQNNKKSFTKLFFIISIILFFILMLFFQDETLNFLMRRNESGLLEIRTLIWDTTLKGLTKSSIIKGWGYGLLSKYGLVHLKWISINGAHNIFIQILAGTGLVGLFLMILYFALIFKTMWKTSRISSLGEPAFKIGIIIFFICNGFSENLFGVGISGSFLCLYFFYNISTLSINNITATNLTK